MYICKECGTEYKIKPDFCDCGNDCFEEVGRQSDVKIEQKKYIDKLELLSYVIFIFCLIFSVLVLLFFPKITPKTNTTTPKQTKIIRETNPNIPDIDFFWIKNKPINIEEPQPVVEQIKEIFQPKPEPKKISQVKVQQQKQPAVNKSKSVQTKVQQSVTQEKTAPKVQPQAQQKREQVKVSNPYEFANYKAALGQKLMSNINILNVKGNGICGVEFAIDETGKLINRAFTFQSDNKTVNDEVYHALMLTPRYSPPPSSYDGHIIKIIFEFGNGNYRARFSN